MLLCIHVFIFKSKKSQPKALISLPQYADTQICIRLSDIELQRLYPKMTHLCINFVKKVIFLPRYTDTHYKMTIFYLCISFLFVAQIEGPLFVSFGNTSECTDAKKDTK